MKRINRRQITRLALVGAAFFILSYYGDGFGLFYPLTEMEKVSISDDLAGQIHQEGSEGKYIHVDKRPFMSHMYRLYFQWFPFFILVLIIAGVDYSKLRRVKS